MEQLIQTIKLKANEHYNKVVAHRRHLHMNPELSFNEVQTAAYVQSHLTALNIPFKTNIGGYGIVALIEGKHATSKVVALRADMDALPITEANQVEYKSKNTGVMHACGHDAHTASLLGVATILSEIKNNFNGTAKLIFQPAEEKLPGGASLMIADGVLQNPTPASIIGQHVMPMIDAGKVGFRSGIYMASTDELYMTVKGKGGHGAMPHLNTDPVLVMAHIIVALQQIVSRNANPIMPSVLSFGKVIANGATNVIPDEVKLEGTFRTLDEKWRTEAHKRMVPLRRSGPGRQRQCRGWAGRHRRVHALAVGHGPFGAAGLPLLTEKGSRHERSRQDHRHHRIQFRHRCRNGPLPAPGRSPGHRRGSPRSDDHAGRFRPGGSVDAGGRRRGG
jgi:amidohydrolase